MEWRETLETVVYRMSESRQGSAAKPLGSATQPARDWESVGGSANPVAAPATQDASTPWQQAARRLSMAKWPPGPLHRTRGETPAHAVSASRAEEIRNQDDRRFMPLYTSNWVLYFR